MAPPTDEPIIALDEIQGNAVPGFLKDHQHFLFFSINDTAPARKCLNRLGSKLSTASEVFKAHEIYKSMRARRGREPDAVHYVFLNVALSARGLQKLISDKEVDKFGDDPFKLGLAARSTLIGDPDARSEPGHASGWVVGGLANPVDGVVIMASDDLPWLLEESKKLVAEFTAQGLSILHEDRGDADAAPKHGHEQFGFKDGVSQPAIRGRWPQDPYPFIFSRTFPKDKAFDTVRADFADPGSRLVWPGHFFFGYGRQKPIDPRTYNPADQPTGPAWAKNGSLLVYRRLRQNVDGFWHFVEATVKSAARRYSANAPSKERLAALLVGRWTPGTPLVRSPEKDIGIKTPGINPQGIIPEAINYFSYADSLPPLPGDTVPNPPDPNGLSCPFGAHIRKVNPRDQTTDLGLPERTPPRSILRRGITYAAKSDDKGLLFVSYQSSIQDQFEFLMREWIGNPEKPHTQAGIDPLLSQTRGRVFHLPVGNKVEEISIPQAFIVPTGGEYFFSPSISFFKTTLAAPAS